MESGITHPCKNVRQRLREALAQRLMLDAPWLQNHLRQCPRCQRRLRGFSRVFLALSLLKAEIHPLDLLMRANAQALGVLQQNVRHLPQAERLRRKLPQVKFMDRIGVYLGSVGNAAACIGILLLLRLGIFSSMEKLQKEGQKGMRQYYSYQLKQAGLQDMANDMTQA